MDISDDGSVCRDANSSDEEEINDHRSQDDSINYEIGEDGGILTVSLLLC